MKAILTHNNADFDAVASLLGTHLLHPEYRPVLPHLMHRSAAEFTALYQNGLPFVRAEDVRAKDIADVILVDTQQVPQLKGLRRNITLRIIDHHPLAADYGADHGHQIEPVGATTTLLVEHMQDAGIHLETLAATLLMLGVYEDTGSLTYPTTTARDIRAAAWLLEHHAALDTVRRFLTPTMSPEQFALYDYLLTASETRTINGYRITLGTAVRDHDVSGISHVAHRLRDTLDADALILVIEMPRYVQITARSTVDAIDVSIVARAFSGGGHVRAAAAAVAEGRAHEISLTIWDMLPDLVRPPVTVGDLMSKGVRTVSPERRITELVSEMRRVGHEGYPVVDKAGQVIGLLTRRDADRAVEHGLSAVTARDVMNAGAVTLSPGDAVQTLEQLIVDSGWGQIPVTEDGRLVGIVTRTDLIKHWAQTHPPALPRYERVDDGQINDVLGRETAALIDMIAAAAQEHWLSVYMVGGVVRDLLLDRPNYDIDFVVEAGGALNAIDFGQALEARYGGHLSSYEPFGTAKWRIDERAAAAIGVPLDSLPHHIDFATSRNEFYQHPTALPTVYAGSIKLDLLRRDFTINTLAVQISPAYAEGRVIDFYGGLNDLRSRHVRVLHSLSFVDDPTRVLRAVRFARRLNFTIEPRTAELIQTSLPMLRRITGERLRNELTLLMQEKRPEDALLELQVRGALAAIHPEFVVDPQVSAYLQRARRLNGRWDDQPFDLTLLNWHLALAHIPITALPSVCERLLFSVSDTRSLLDAAALVQQRGVLSAKDVPPSQICARLDGVSEVALLAGWIMTDDERLRRYHRDWQHVRPQTNGHSLRALGLEPGPQYKRILDRLRAAWLDGEISEAAQEEALLQALIKEGEAPDDRP
jgi:tRNA nucleotidyltransferase (CCA-adding enzyme)